MRWLLLSMILMLSCSTSQKATVFDGSTIFDGKIYVDRFDNTYIITPTREVNMYDPFGKLVYSYANDQIGQISSLDVSNPQNIVLFISDFGIITILDNTLSVLSSINITDLGYLDVVSIAAANDGFFWVYDPINFKLVKLNTQGQKITESNRLSDYNLKAFDPIHMIERDTKVFISTKNGMLHVFDNFGQFIKSFRFDGIGKFVVDNETISYITNQKLKSYNIKYLESEETVFHHSFIDFDYNRSSGIVILKRDGTMQRLGK